MLTEVKFITVTVLALTLSYLGLGRNKKLIGTLVLWAVIVGALSYGGFFKNTQAMPPRMLLVLLPALITPVVVFKLAPSNINRKYLLAIHSLRLPVELVLHKLYLQSMIPIIMTYEGWNFDIVMGISAIALLMYELSGKSIHPIFFKTWNLCGLALVTFIVTTAILSSPLPIQLFAFHQPNIAILTFPYTLLPAIVVPIVYAAHFVGLADRKFS